ncbi:MAG: hypothetical protein CMN28_06950 [Salinisphaeraceae bacterium]|nr:hypothetical protein [Salinisphaeraceae bacterium]
MTPTRLLNWIVSLGSDAVGRFALQLGSTIVFARLLAPEQFGQAALVVVIMAVLSIIVTAPFEEGLVQQRRVRRMHFSAALGALLLLALLLYGLTAALALTVGEWLFGAAGIGPLIAGFGLILLAEGPYAVFCAAARRRRRFGSIAAANFAGLLLGTVVGIGLALSGVGVWSLLAVRVVSRYVSAVWIAVAAGYRIFPAWSPRHLRSSARFAGWYFADRCTTNLTDAVFQALVTSLLGLAANGYLNMAMRIVEPIRGASGAISHNLAMAYFTRLQDTPARLRDSLEAAMQHTCLILFPIFVGLAAVSGTLIILLAGEQWQPAVPVAVLLALSAALISPTEFVHTAVTARGRAELGFATSLTGLVVTIVSVAALAPLGVIAAGWSRLLYYGGDAAWGVGLAAGLFGIPTLRFARLLWRLVAAATVMGLLVWWLPGLLPPDLPRLGVLAAQVGAGALTYGLLVAVLVPDLVRQTLSQLLASRGG